VSRQPRRAARTRHWITPVAAVALGGALTMGILVAVHWSNATAPWIQRMSPLPAVSAISTPLDWPIFESAAVSVPQLGLGGQSHQDLIRPIASVTKLMTAKVLLQRLPLRDGDTGPCINVSNADVATYLSERQSIDSTAAVRLGEKICESDLLTGLLVHSASNYAYLLIRLTGLTDDQFVGEMNSDARSMGLVNTHYTDPTGISTADTSTAHDQLILAEKVMEIPFIRKTVNNSRVNLPVAGLVGSFTPLVGHEGVVGVKSGRTSPAGGCDVMARWLTVRGQRVLVYAVVLGTHGGDVLARAGAEALTLTSSVATNVSSYQLRSGVVVGSIGWGTQRTAVVTRTSFAMWAWNGVAVSGIRMQWKPGLGNRAVHAGENVGTLFIPNRFGATTKIAVIARGSLSRLPLLERLL